MNIGVGGLFKGKKANIKAHWDHLVKKLDELNLVKDYEFEPKGYIYFAMAFSVFVELLNMKVRKKPPSPLKLRNPRSAKVAET